MRRKVLYHLCVMCDFLKGGDTVTAMALEDLPCEPQYWVATNGYSEKIKGFLSKILHLLGDRAQASPRQRETTPSEQELFEQFVSFQKQRIKQYRKLLQPSIKREMKRASQSRALLSPSTTDEISEYERWLKRFQLCLGNTSSYFELSQWAYNERHSEFLQIGIDPITRQPVMNENPFRASIRHYIGRLTAPRRAATILAYATASHLSMFLDYTIQLRKSEPGTPRPLLSSRLTVEGISGRMFSNEADLGAFRDALRLLDTKVSIMARILDHYEGREWKPRVHAELILLEHLYHEKCVFFDDDRYIACSKAACFCCYHYICGHPGLFNYPPCHNKVYINWAPPNTGGKDGDARYRQQHKTMNHLITEVRRCVIEKIMNVGSRKTWHPDSSTGITPSIACGQDLDKHQSVEDSLITSSSLKDGQKEATETEHAEECSESEDNEDGGVFLT